MHEMGQKPVGEKGLVMVRFTDGKGNIWLILF